MTGQNKKRHFELVDVLRGFAAATVLVYHAIEHFQWHDFPITHGLVWFRWGWLGVDIFFVISGFVITLSALNLSEKEGYAGFQKKFMAKRLKRIVPLHYLSLAVFIFLIPGILRPRLIFDLPAHLLFLHNLHPDFHGSINGPNWSVATEMQFYLLISFGIYFFKTKNLLYVSLIFLGICYLWRILFFLIFSQDYPQSQYLLFISVTQLPGMLDLFLGGILLAFFVRSKWFYIIFGGKYSLLISLFFTTILCYATLSLYANNSEFWNNSWMVVFFRTLTSISVSFIILTLCQIKLNNFFKKLIAPLIYIGTISYGIYLFHLPVILTVKKFNLQPFESFLITCAVTFIFATLSWEFFESKFLKENNFFGRQIDRITSYLAKKNEVVTQAAQNPGAQRVELIDVLRGFAALSVVVYHCIDFYNWETFPKTYGLVWFRWGWLGVDIFFVISGFVITLSALNQTSRHGFENFQKEFLFRRARRIVPLHYLTLAIFLVFSPAVIHSDIVYDLLAHMLFIHNAIPTYHGSINAPSWSLGVEMQFYFLIACAIYILKKEYLLFLSLIFILTCYVWRALIFYFLPPGGEQHTHTLFLWTTQLPGMLDLFLAGILLAFFVKSKWFPKIFGGQYSLFILIMFTTLFCYAVLSIYANNGNYWDNAWMVVFFHTLTAISVALIILCFCQIKLNKFFGFILAPFIYLGVISYGIYLLHFPIILGVRKLHLEPLISFAITILATLILATLSWEFFEKRFLKR